MDMIKKLWLKKDGTVLVIVDVQERLVPAMDERIRQQVITNIRAIAEAAGIIGLPVLATEQYPKGLGGTVPELASYAQGPIIEKNSFSCCGEESFLDALEEKKARQILLVGMEAHVCVFQTLLDLQGRGYQVHLVRDAICSRNKTDFLTALDSARLAGATVTTTEMALFQLLQKAGTAEFKAVSALIKDR
ncbi:MAG: hydrolase [Desulfuromonadales bacterium]|nr:hydrolase [Desulfuromonadales bacterium]MDW7757603.1 hydrolase [Desulfuromonadales bacterium]